MFDPQKSPRVFAVPVGVDFSDALYEGLMARFEKCSPEMVARTEVYVNTRRMQRHLTELFHSGPALLMPKLRLITDLDASAKLSALPMAMSPMRRRLEVAQLVRGLLRADPTLAAEYSAFDLADSLINLFAEMQGEGVSSETIAQLNVSDQSGHWQRALAFFTLVQDYLSSRVELTPEGRQRLAVERLGSEWEISPPKHPIIVAGSTGSRGATSLFMQAISKLPQGAVILPGMDFDLPLKIWKKLSAENGSEAHPQYRLKAFLDALEIEPSHVVNWPGRSADNPERAALISLSLRPAPVTDQWLEDGAKLERLKEATAGLTLIEAPSPRAEADAIALCLRQAVSDNKTAALISPDRMLTRQVTAALDRWQLVPDDSAGLPLQLSAPGRFLRHISSALIAPMDTISLLVLLRHPLCNSTGEHRGTHILRTNQLELELRRNGPPYPSVASIMTWAKSIEERGAGSIAWAEWICSVLFASNAPFQTLAEHVSIHWQIAEKLSAGPNNDGAGALWKEAAGRECLRIFEELKSHADIGGEMSAREYDQLVNSLLAAGEVRNPDIGHPQVLIWGTLEARVQSADLVILGGMNEGSWPEIAPADPWLNRPLRAQAGLMLPERKIGLSAHDYQQSVCSKETVISRSIRSDDAQTVPSRWINRLTNLLAGLKVAGGPQALEQIRKRGNNWVNRAAVLQRPAQEAKPAYRPSPCPPTEARPTGLSVTQIKTLIRDPYAIYAKNILNLKPLDPLYKIPNPALRGTITHRVLERFVNEGIDPNHAEAFINIMSIADEALSELCPWPAERILWRSRIAYFAPHFLAEETSRRLHLQNAKTELSGSLTFPNIGFTLRGTADRIDVNQNGTATIYDYKTGQIPSEKEQLSFDKQLLLEAAMVERGAFKSIGERQVHDAIYVGLGSQLKNLAAPLEKSPPEETLKRFESLISKWANPKKGYTSRRANQSTRFAGDYDHLARFGEWDETHEPIADDLT